MPAVYNITESITVGTTYTVSAFVLVNGTETATVRLSGKYACTGESDEYPWIHNKEDVAPDVWTELSGDLPIPEGCDLTDALIYFEGTAAGTDVLVDDVSIVVAAPAE